MFRHDTYTGGNHYWIVFRNGTHEVRLETDENYDDNETVFRGHYEKCVKWLEDCVAKNYEYDHDL